MMHVLHEIKFYVMNNLVYRNTLLKLCLNNARKYKQFFYVLRHTANVCMQYHVLNCFTCSFQIKHLK